MKTDIIGSTFHQPNATFLLTAALSLAISLPAAAQPISLGRLQTGAAITFTHTASGEWGIEIAGGPVPRIAQPKPAAIKVYRADDDIRELSAGYKTIRHTAIGIDATADVPSADGVVFHVHDVWGLSDGVLSVRREVKGAGQCVGRLQLSHRPLARPRRRLD